MPDRLACPVCSMDDLLEREDVWECTTCGHEWSRERVVLDANGHPLADGDAVTLVKDLKVKGSSSTLKAGTKIKKIRLVDPAQNADHDIDAKTPEGMGVLIRSKWVKKA
ncbi:MAG: alkylphosphonate utilization protein [bacterium]|nr:alkylphosphonate utilization protein [bacterium]